jgi:hypothetical protein
MLTPVSAPLQAGEDAAVDGGELTVLVVGTDDWAIEQGAGVLEDRGHRVLRCHEPGEPAFPCNALREGRTCPLDVGFDAVVTMRARTSAPPALPEFGVVCALHAGAPLVVAGMTTQHPFGPWASRVVDRAVDVATACEELFGDEDSPASAATRRQREIDLRHEA